MFDPINPAAPVTAIYMAYPQSCFANNSSGRTTAVRIADDDSGSAVGDAHRAAEIAAGRKHHRQRGDHGIASAAYVGDFACLRRHVETAIAAEQRHAFLALRHQ